MGWAEPLSLSAWLGPCWQPGCWRAPALNIYKCNVSRGCRSDWASKSPLLGKSSASKRAKSWNIYHCFSAKMAPLFPDFGSRLRLAWTLACTSMTKRHNSCTLGSLEDLSLAWKPPHTLCGTGLGSGRRNSSVSCPNFFNNVKRPHCRDVRRRSHLIWRPARISYTSKDTWSATRS